MDRIVEIAQSFVRSGRFCIEVSRDLEADCLMRAFLVVVVCGELIITCYRPVSPLCENRVTRLCTVVIGTAFATYALRQTIN